MAFFVSLDAMSFSKTIFSVFVVYLHTVCLVNRCAASPDPYILGFRVNDAHLLNSDGGIATIAANTNVTLRLFGHHLYEGLLVKFAYDADLHQGNDCRHVPTTRQFKLEETSTNLSVSLNYSEWTGQLVVNMDPHSAPYYFCFLDNNDDYVFQGAEPWLALRTALVEEEKPLMPLWLQITLLVVLLLMSGLFSGLNLGLMSIDITDLEIILNVGSDSEKENAKIIYPIRKRGNYLLCSILLGNVMINSTISILMEDLTSGLFAVIISTIIIVICGEIIPQSVCSRHGLVIGAKTIWITKIFMFLTAPLSFPISLLLDKILGEEIDGFDRDHLRELLRMEFLKENINQEEYNIIAGALKAKEKKVEEIMTPIEQVFMLDYNSILDFQTVSQIMKRGFTRIPVYEGTRDNVVHILYVKDLSFIDPADEPKLSTVVTFYKRPLQKCYGDELVMKVFDEMRQGRSHLSLVVDLLEQEQSDPVLRTVGLITMEDIIEAILQEDILDEKDALNDDRNLTINNPTDFSEFVKPTLYGVKTQLVLAAFQFLSSSVPSFKPSRLLPDVLRKLLHRPEVWRHVVPAPDKPTYLYRAGQAANYFMMVVEGQAQIEVGHEHMRLDAGPFSIFGEQALEAVFSCDRSQEVRRRLVKKDSKATPLFNQKLGKDEPYTPDYHILAEKKLVFLLIFDRWYLAAMRATEKMRRLQENRQPISDQLLTETFTREWDHVQQQYSPKECSEIGRTDVFGAAQERAFQLEQKLLLNGSTTSNGDVPIPEGGADSQHDEVVVIIEPTEDDALLAKHT